MILSKISLRSFGGVSDASLLLNSGLNVVLGPNEAGKSTFFNAIQHTLFTPTKMTKTVFERQMERFLPLSGGDTIETTLEFSHGEKSHVLQKRWGKGASSELVLSDGSVIQSDETIQARMSEMLPASAATVRSVLLTYQSGLSMILDDLKKEKEPVYTLADILKNAVQNTDGVSIERFSSLIEKQYIGYFERWDSRANRPEGGRGIENPWKKNAGSIVTAWYERESLAKKLKDMQEQEDLLSGLFREIETAESRIIESDDFLEQNGKAFKDAARRGGISAELTLAKNEAKKLQEDYDIWPQLERRISEISEKVKAIEKSRIQVAEELGTARKREEYRKIIEHHERVLEKKKQYDEAAKTFGQLKEVPDNAIQTARKLSAGQKEIRTAMLAGKLEAQFKARKDMVIEIRKALLPPESRELKENQSVEIAADGQMTILHDEWEMHLRSGETDHRALIDSYESKQKQLGKLLNDIGAVTVDDAERIAAVFSAAKREVESRLQAYKEELGNVTFEQLEQQLQELGINQAPDKDSGESFRSIQDISTDAAEMDFEIKKLQEEAVEKNIRLAELQKSYIDRDKLFDEHLYGRKAAEKALSAELAACEALPDGFESEERFIEAFEEARDARERFQSDRGELIERRARLEGQLPDESVEEVALQCTEAEEQFERVLREGMTVSRILNRTRELIEGAENEPFSGLETTFSEYVTELTTGRYKSAEIKSSLPESLVRDDGSTLPYSYLSSGTKDVFSLVLRLSMAHHFLAGKEGFLIMDDPLVDMDPDRRRRAAALLARFAESSQLVIFTCHPEHAALFEKSRIVELL